MPRCWSRIEWRGNACMSLARFFPFIALVLCRSRRLLGELFTAPQGFHRILTSLSSRARVPFMLFNHRPTRSGLLAQSRVRNCEPNVPFVSAKLMIYLLNRLLCKAQTHAKKARACSLNSRQLDSRATTSKSEGTESARDNRSMPSFESDDSMML